MSEYNKKGRVSWYLVGAYHKQYWISVIDQEENDVGIKFGCLVMTWAGYTNTSHC